MTIATTFVAWQSSVQRVPPLLTVQDSISGTMLGWNNRNHLCGVKHGLKHSTVSVYYTMTHHQKQWSVKQCGKWIVNQIILNNGTSFASTVSPTSEYSALCPSGELLCPFLSCWHYAKISWGNCMERKKKTKQWDKKHTVQIEIWSSDCDYIRTPRRPNFWVQNKHKMSRVSPKTGKSSSTLTSSTNKMKLQWLVRRAIFNHIPID